MKARIAREPTWAKLATVKLHTPLALVLLACGGAQGGASAGSEYSGPNELDFLVTTPVRRQMPPERHRGTAVVVSDDGTLVTLELRMVDGGDVCTVQARRGGGALAVQPGQCSSRFVYEENPTAATVQIQEGTVTLGDGTLSVALSGGFVANVRSGEGTSAVSGVARWTFEGRR